MPFYALHLRMGGSPTPAGTGRTKHSRTKTLYSWKQQEGEAFPADAQTVLVLRHRSPCCGKGSWKFSDGKESHSGTESLNRTSAELPQLVSAGHEHLIWCLYLYLHLFVYLLKSLTGGGDILLCLVLSMGPHGTLQLPALSGFTTMFLWGVWRPLELMILPLFCSLNLPSLIFFTGCLECPIWWYLSIICYLPFFLSLFVWYMFIKSLNRTYKHDSVTPDLIPQSHP